MRIIPSAPAPISASQRRSIRRIAASASGPGLSSPSNVDETARPALATEPDWRETKLNIAAASIADLVDDPDLRSSVQHAVDDANKAVSKAESIRRFRILNHDWTEDGGQLTPSMKLKRSVVMTEHATDVEFKNSEVE